MGYLSFRGFLVQLTLIHIINLIHPAAAVKSSCTGLEASLPVARFGGSLLRIRSDLLPSPDAPLRQKPQGRRSLRRASVLSRGAAPLHRCHMSVCGCWIWIPLIMCLNVALPFSSIRTTWLFTAAKIILDESSAVSPSLASLTSVPLECANELKAN